MLYSKTNLNVFRNYFFLFSNHLENEYSTFKIIPQTAQSYTEKKITRKTMLITVLEVV